MKVKRDSSGFIESVKLEREDTISLDITLAFIIAEGVKQFRNRTCSHPHNMTKKSWDKELSKIQEAFELIAQEKHIFPPDDENIKKIEKGLKLFHKYYFNLWS